MYESKCVEQIGPWHLPTIRYLLANDLSVRFQWSLALQINLQHRSFVLVRKRKQQADRRESLEVVTETIYHPRFRRP